MLFGLYRIITDLSGGVIESYLARRVSRGKEDPDRLGERKGIPSRDRPDGKLIWMHAASNGEAMSALPLASEILDTDPNAHLLLTTGTVTSARLVANRLPDRAFHQFVPVDRRAWVRAFLDHWRPDAAIWVESEFWPNLIMECRKDRCPMALVNGRISERSHLRWKRAPAFAKQLLSTFDVCLAQSSREAKRLSSLGATNADYVGNLKHAAPVLDADQEALNQLNDAVAGRPIWLAASTHPGEEAIVLDVHRSLVRKRPDLLTIIVPRHPVRGATLFDELSASGISVCRRSTQGAIPAPTDGLYLADTLGELGLFYRLSDVVLIGGTLLNDIGGHNPVEPAKLDCAILLGPDMANFDEMANDMSERGAALRTESRTLARDIASLLDNQNVRIDASAAAIAYADEGNDVPARVLKRLETVLEAR